MAVLATDDFNRANNADLGTNWTTPTASTFTISSNTAVPSALNANKEEYYSGISWPDDQYSQAALTVTGVSGGGAGIGLLCRQASAVYTHYRVTTDHDPSVNVELSKRITGTKTVLWSRSQTWSDGATVRLDAQGTTFRVWFSGVQLGADQTDAAIASGNAGIAYSSTTTSASLDNWEGGNFTTAGVAPRPLVVDHAVTRASFY